MSDSATRSDEDKTLSGVGSSAQDIPEYCLYWNLHKPPFDNVPDPSMYVDAHESVENTIAETIFAIEEGNECIAVIVGDVGLGKTLSLRMILDSINHEKYRIAFVTNPDMSFVQLLKEIIGQLTGEQCEIKGKIELLEMFNRIIFQTYDEHKKVLIFIDEANALTPTNLESLRLLTNMQDDTKNLFTIVLAGQMELAHRLEHPRRANLFQRIGTYNRIDKIPDLALLRHYVEARLKLAGSSRPIFTEDAFEVLWEYSEQGVPRLINRICKLCLKAGETSEFTEISGEVVEQIGQRFQKLTGPILQKRKPRKRALHEGKYKELVGDASDEAGTILSEDLGVTRGFHKEKGYEIEETDEIEAFELTEEKEGAEPTEEAGRAESKEQTGAFEAVEELKAAEEVEEKIEEKEEDLRALKIETKEIAEEETAKLELSEELEAVDELKEEDFIEKEQTGVFEAAEEIEEKIEEKEEDLRALKIETKEIAEEETAKLELSEELEAVEISEEQQTEDVLQEEKGVEFNDFTEEIYIKDIPFTAFIPRNCFEDALVKTQAERDKMAGILAAKTMESHKNLFVTKTIDPVFLWCELKDYFLQRLIHTTGV